MTEGARVRRMARDELDAVSALARTVWQATYPALISQAQIDAMLDARYAPPRIAAQLDDAHHAWWVAEVEGGLAGFAHAILEEDACKLDKLYVHPEFQRHGVGAALAGTVEHWAREQGLRRLRLQVNRGNAQALGAYEKYGFRIVESRVFAIGGGFVMDDHVMEKSW